MRSAGSWKVALFIAGWNLFTAGSNRCGLCGYAAEPPKPGEITFAHLTDAHIFDDGYKKTSADAMRQTANDREALHWAVDRINNAVNAGARIDFVAYTGDLGLQNVSFPADGSCYALPLMLDPGTPPTTLPWAVKEIVDELNRLLVGTVLFVAGNNDIQDEDVTDGRFDCFMTALEQKVATLPRSLRVKALGLDQAVTINGVRIAGLNTAGFKAAKNYESACAPSNPQLPQGCPEPQMKALHALAAGNLQAPLLLFTHVPDLIDPYFRQKNPGVRKSVWDIPAGARSAWETEVCGSNVLAVFTGHFHDSNRKVYGSNTSTADLTYTPCVAKKTWVAPPLALKNQETAPTTARGFLIVKVANGKVADVTPQWFNGSPPPSPVPPTSDAGPKPVSRFMAHVEGIAAAVALAFLLAWIVWLGKQGDGNRDLNALAAAVASALFAIAVVWFCRSELEVTDSAIIIALLLCPLLVYGIVSGRLTEFSGPGGWGAKFGQVAKAPAEHSDVSIDLTHEPSVRKALLPETPRTGAEAAAADPVYLTLKLGTQFNAGGLLETLPRLLARPNLKLAAFLDANGRLVSYVPCWRLRSEMQSNSTGVAKLLDDANKGEEKDVLRFPGMLPPVRALLEGMTNMDALKAMDNLDAMPVVDKKGRLVGIAERDRILAKMFLSLSKT